MTSEEKDYAILEVYLEKGPACAVDEARRYFLLDPDKGREKVREILEQAGERTL